MVLPGDFGVGVTPASVASSGRTAAGRRGTRGQPQDVEPRPVKGSDEALHQAPGRTGRLVREHPFRYEFRPES